MSTMLDLHACKLPEWGRKVLAHTSTDRRSRCHRRSHQPQGVYRGTPSPLRYIEAGEIAASTRLIKASKDKEHSTERRLLQHIIQLRRTSGAT
jgi:hypothetical protein